MVVPGLGAGRRHRRLHPRAARGFLIDASGRRFANESLPYDQMGRVMQATTDRVRAHLIFDSRFGGHLPAIAPPRNRAEDHLQAGTWVRAASVTELAKQLDLPSEVLDGTCARFNGFTTDGVNHRFHRGEDPYDLFFADRSHGPNPCLVPVDQPRTTLPASCWATSAPRAV